MLSDRDIHEFLESGDIKISPLNKDLIQPSSVDVTLGNQFRVLDKQKSSIVDSTQPKADLTNLIAVEPNGQFLLHPGEFVLGTTIETVTLGSQIASKLEGKSSLGRLGLMIHATAGFIDPGFRGQITLELSNVSRIPIIIKPGMRIGQLAFFELRSPCLQPYGTGNLNSKYQDQVGPTESRKQEESK